MEGSAALGDLEPAGSLKGDEGVVGVDGGEVQPIVSIAG